jgi:hypothetical protein
VGRAERLDASKATAAMVGAYLRQLGYTRSSFNVGWGPVHRRGGPYLCLCGGEGRGGEGVRVAGLHPARALP